MPVTVNVNGLSVVHRGSGGIATATVPDVCKTPSPGGPVPIPYPNIAMSSDLMGGTTTVTIDGNPAAIQGSKFLKSTGDEAGVAGGLVSSMIAGEAQFISFSPTVMLDGKPSCRLTDKMLMNKGNTVCMGGVLQSPVPPAQPVLPANVCGPTEPATASQKPKRCVLKKVRVKCSHTDRGLQIDLSKRDVQVFQVIADPHKPETLTIDWEGSCADKHDEYCPGVGISAPGRWHRLNAADRTSQAHTYTVKQPEALLIREPFWLFKVLCNQTALRPDYHTIVGMLCNGHESADVQAGQWLQVQVFPKAKFGAKMEIGYSHKTLTDSKGKSDPLKYDRNSDWTIALEGAVEYGATKAKYGVELGQHVDDRLPFFGSLIDAIGRSAKVFECMAARGADVTMTPRWPKWNFSGDLALAEVVGKPKVATNGSFKFGFDPLFGMELKVSLLDWLIRYGSALAGPPGAVLGQVLIQIRKRFATGAGTAESFAQASLDIDIVLVAGGTIKGGFGFEFKDGKSAPDPAASMIEGSIDVKVSGHAKAKARVWKVVTGGTGEFGAGGSDGASPCEFGAKLSPKAGAKNLAMQGSVFFNGLAFYYLFYLEIGVAGGENSKTKPGSDYGDIKQTSDMTNRQLEKKNTCVLMQPWSWPKSAA